jgi:hypothetical protein
MIQEAFDHVNWTKLIQILKIAGRIDHHERRLTSKLCVDQSVKLKLDQGEASELRLERG